MSVCDAHEAVHGSPKQLAPGEGFLLAAAYMRRSAVQERNIELGMKGLGAMMGMSRDEYRAQLEATQGGSPWVICEQCAEFLCLAEADMTAARQAAMEWSHDRSIPGHTPGKRKVTARDSQASKRKWWPPWRLPRGTEPVEDVPSPSEKRISPIADARSADERKLAKLKVLVAVAKADGRVESGERRLLESFCADLGLSPAELAAVLEQRATVSKGDLPTSPDDKKQLLVDILAMAAADGSIAKAELSVAKQVAKALGLSNEDIEECLRKAKLSPKKKRRSETPQPKPSSNSIATTVSRETHIAPQKRLSPEVAELTSALRDKDANVREKAATELYKHPCAATVKALEDALKDAAPNVRGCAAESLRVIGARKTHPIDVRPLLEALKNEPREGGVEYGLTRVLRDLGAGLAADTVLEQKQQAELEAAGGSKAEKLRAIRPMAAKLNAQGSQFDVAFSSLLSELQNEDTAIRAAASTALSDSPNAVKKLNSIYRDRAVSDPRLSVLAGRVLGRKADAGQQRQISAEMASRICGMNAAFTPCVCGCCSKLNVGIPVPPAGLRVPFYGRSQDEGAYTLPVLCDHCGKEFFIAWDNDPR